MNTKLTINIFFSLVAAIVFIFGTVPQGSACVLLRDACQVEQMPSCCAPVDAGTTVMLNDCCCKPSPVNTAMSPGLIVSSSTPFVQVAVLPPLHSLTNASTGVVSRGSTAETVSPSKIYLLKRSLLI